ncbi:hypothetical protein NDU88_004554 [Pleurodeles waltl]|uniref:Uncharacterized protein n=1 Tax=Pleurodeles waltl TaxID=8319 RepID=A0AAV7QIP0_PLEWA|nr:hypothetical protein NDU88_004554 [Pleurodeles waltl]
MGKTDKTQAWLQFERRKTQGPAGDGTVTDSEKGPEGTAGEEQDLRQLLVSMQHSLNQIDGKINALTYRMDRMSERIDKHTERLDHVENRVSATEDWQTELTGGQMKLSKELGALKLKMDQRPSVCHAGGLQKTPGSGIRSSYCAKDALMVDKNTMTYRTPTNTPKACVFARQIRLQADDFLQKDDLAGRYLPSTPNPLGLSATRRKPIKGAAGRPIQFKYDDILTQAKLVEQAKAQTTKVLPGKAVPLYVHVALFAFVAFLALVFFTMEHNPENPFHAFVEKVEVHQPQ